MIIQDSTVAAEFGIWVFHDSYYKGAPTPLSRGLPTILSPLVKILGVTCPASSLGKSKAPRLKADGGALSREIPPSVVKF